MRAGIMDVIGSRVGAYQIVEHLASGGMGAVFVARHEVLGREAVIKLLHPAVSNDPDVARRFVNEARAATSIEHPGIVEVFDLGTLPSGESYIAMERLRGTSLADRLRQGPLSVPEALALGRQLASALGAAHDLGIVHRDLKPQNLYLACDPTVRDPIVDGGERLKILDFGIAKLARIDGTLATATGALLGTPAYMSPEQCVSAGRVDGRSDLYAVGCILFEALCGRPPFVGGIEVIAAQVRDAPPHVRSLRSEIPEALDRLVAKLLEKDPAQRLQSCHDLVTALASLTSVPAIEPSDRRRRGRRSPVAIGVGLGALIAAAGAGYAASRVLDARTVDEPLDASPARRTSDAPGLGHVSPPGHDAVTVPDLPAPPTRTDSPKASKRPAPKHDEDVGEIGENDVVGEKAKRDYAVSYTTLQKLCMTTSSWLDTYAQCPGVPTSQSSDLRRQLDAVISGLPNLPSEDWDLTAEHCEAWTATMLEVLRLAHCLE